MQFILHLGAHCTGEDLLIRSLRMNQPLLRDLGIHVPNPADYRDALRDAIAATLDGMPDPDIEARLWAALQGPEGTTRVVVSWNSILGFPVGVLAGGAALPAWASPGGGAAQHPGWARGAPVPWGA